MLYTFSNLSRCLFQLILQKELHVVYALSHVCGQDRTLLASILLKIFLHEKLESLLLCTLNDREISMEGIVWMCQCDTLKNWVNDSVQSLSRVQLLVTPWTGACQASLSIANSRSLPKLMSIESVMPSSHLILCCPLLLLSSVFPASGSFPMSQFFAKVAKVLEFQLQHQSFP